MGCHSRAPAPATRKQSGPCQRYKPGGKKRSRSTTFCPTTSRIGRTPTLDRPALVAERRAPVLSSKPVASVERFHAEPLPSQHQRPCLDPVQVGARARGTVIEPAFRQRVLGPHARDPLG